MKCPIVLFGLDSTAGFRNLTLKDELVECRFLNRTTILFKKNSVMPPSFIRIAGVHVTRLVFIENDLSLREVVGDPKNSTRGV